MKVNEKEISLEELARLRSIEFEKVEKLKYALLKMVYRLNPEEVADVKRAIELAERCHKDQYRNDNITPYISHPLNVGIRLAANCLDLEMIIAGILHDVREDSKISKEELIEMFGERVAALVEGMSKDSSEKFPDKSIRNANNLLKKMKFVVERPEIIPIKKADVEHNTSTLDGFDNRKKQQENGEEAYDLRSPFAYLIGAKESAERIDGNSFKYMNPELYEKTKKIRDEKILFNYKAAC